ncbi:MAG: hypothetical protein ABR584_06435 [Candidatus Baltobacteraceae bacterium]
MTPEQHEGVVAGFLHLLDRSDTVRQQWLSAVQENAQKPAEQRSAALAALVQKTLGLAQTPSPGDMQKMLAHANTVLADRVANIKAHGDVPRTVGSIFNTD